MICIEVRIFRAELRNFTRNTWKLPFSKPIFAIFRSKNFHCVVFTKKIQKYRGGKFLKLPHCDDDTVWKNEKFTLTEKIFRQITYLVLSFVKTLLWQNFCQKSVRVNFRNFHTHCVVEKLEIFIHLKNISSNQLNT